MKKEMVKAADIQSRLHRLARNLWWSWNPAAQEIFEHLSPLTWEQTNHNPVAVLAQFSEAELKARCGNSECLAKLIPVLDTFDRYMSRKTHIARGKSRSHADDPVAYFCAEFGIHECLPMYSGGLGVLAGDHTKSASDLGLPFVGVGLFYRQGYFQQRIDGSGGQQENYPHTNPELIPVELVKDRFGNTLLSFVEIGSNRVYIQGWRINVGQAQVYLLDTDVRENEEHLRGLTALAYGGDVTARIRQEIVLGVGGIRFLRALGVEPAVFHMNEGHAAFLTIELLREHVQAGKPLEKAVEEVKQSCIFTTHTPVPAGHDQFPRDLFEFTLHPYADSMHISPSELMKLGQAPEARDNEMFNMTLLALRFSRAANAVSKRHGEVSRLMWKDFFNVKDAKNVPIGHVTNGVHVPSWATRTSWEFWERHNSHRWKEYLMDEKFWKHVTKPDVVNDEELWSLRYQLRRELVEFIRKRASEFHIYGGVPSDEFHHHLLSPDALTIGFARRFATYKRASLIFHDLMRSETLFNNADRPIQIIFAGKSHPRDNEGKDVLRKIVEMTRHPHFFGKVVFIENYDMNIARHLVSGCDVWLNTPRKPLEASGTSGEKVAINGGLHASVLDGWWYEAYNGKNGWAIGDHEDNLSHEEQDRRDAEALYHVLHDEIIPLFYQRDKSGIPQKWIARIRNATQSIIPIYNTHRMVTEYMEKYYFPKE